MSVLEKIKSHHFYKNNLPQDIYWESEEEKLFTSFTIRLIHFLDLPKLLLIFTFDA